MISKLKTSPKESPRTKLLPLFLLPSILRFAQDDKKKKPTLYEL